MKKLTAIISMLLCAVLLFSCGGKSTLNVNVAILDKKAQAFEFDDAIFYRDSTEGAETVLMYQYGIEDEELLNAISSYVITSPGTNSAKTFAVIKFNDGTDKEIIEKTKQCIKDVYIENIINRTALYDATQADIAEKGTFVTYDNALAYIAYDTTGNTDIIEIFN